MRKAVKNPSFLRYLSALMVMIAGVTMISGAAFAQCANPSGVAADIVYNSTSNDMTFCNGTNWLAMGQGPKTGVGCTSPTGVAGDIRFNITGSVMQYCNSYEWVAMGRESNGYPLKTSGLTIGRSWPGPIDFYAGDYGDSAISGDLLVTTDTFYQTVILWSVQNSNQPLIISAVTDALLGGVRDVDIQGDYIYAAAPGTDRLVVINIADRNNPAIAGSVQDATNLDGASSVKVRGNYAYVTAANSDRLTVVNISNPAAPTVTGNVTSTNIDGASDLALSGDYAFVVSAGASGNRRITAVNISNPASPSITGSLNDNTRFQGTQGIAIQGNYAYVSGRTNDYFTIVNISNPASMTLMGSITSGVTLDLPSGVAVDGNYAYVTWERGISVIDVSNPNAPSVVGNINEDWWYFSGADGIAYQNGRVYATSTGMLEMWAYDVTAPASPQPVGRVSGYPEIAGGGGVIMIQGGYFYMTSAWGDGIRIYDISDPMKATPVATYYVCESPMSIRVRDNYAYMACSDGLFIVDITDKLKPNLVGSLQSAELGNSLDVHLSGNYAYVTSDTQLRMNVVDISNPASPTLAGTITNANLQYCHSLDKSGNHVFVNCNNYLIAINVSNPASPTITSSYAPSSYNGAFSDMEIVGNYAYVMSYSNDRLHIIDITNPASMTRPGTITNAQIDGPAQIVYENGYIIVAAYEGSRLTIINVSNPASPSITTSIQNNTYLQYAGGLGFGNGHAFVDGGSYLNIVDLRDLASACVNPAGVQGDILYNSTSNTVQFCEGNEWIATGR